ncbi:MAG TPA: HDOD domain-containing protein [Candidatus Sulfotelmatobacter sp.]|nr:HDOD domain-containing protein [Candidatus Sulfotelmatobacter sp.]
MQAAGQAPAEKASPCLARQPILTKDEKVVGYELLFRETPDERHFHSDAENATNSIIDTLNVIGFDTVCDGRMAFINCTEQMLLKEFFLLLPPERTVLELQESVPADAIVCAACQQLKQKSYRIALDNFTPHDPREALVPYADFLKIDIRKQPYSESAALAAKYALKNCQMIAQKVETRVQMLEASGHGYALFQGYFFRHPERMRARHIPASQTTHLRLLQAISGGEVDLDAVEDLIKHDASLCYRLLRYLNSPLVGIPSPVRSIRHGMALLGERELVRWLRMATALVMGQEKCSDLVLASLVRARFCELISPKVDCGTSDLFLIGMLSLMDAILEVPMGLVVEGLAFDPAIKDALLAAKKGNETSLTPLYRLMLAREFGDWEDVTLHARKLGLSLPQVNRAYNQAMVWAREVTAVAP